MRENELIGTNDTVSGIDESDETSYVEGEGLYYSTGKVASILGISRDMVRIHIKDFEEYLDVVHSNASSKGSHIRLSSASVELLDNIIQLRKSRSVEETKRILDDKDMCLLFAKGTNIESVVGRMLLKNNEFLLKQFKDLVDSEYKGREMALEERSQCVAESNEALSQEVTNLKETIDLQNEMIKKQNEQLNTLIEQSQKKGLFSFFKK